MPDPDFRVFEQKATSIQGLEGFCDGYLSEKHKRTVSVTEYPVETGENITDHAIREPDMLTLEGYVSSINVGMESGAERSERTWSEIDRMMNENNPLSVVTQLGIYVNMMLISAETVKDNKTRNSALIQLKLQKILLDTDVVTTMNQISANPESNMSKRVGETNHGRVNPIEVMQGKKEGLIGRLPNRKVGRVKRLSGGLRF